LTPGASTLDPGLNLSQVVGHVSLVVKAERNDVVDQFERQCGILIVQHLGRVTFVVPPHKKIEVDPVPRYADFTH
jgi:hypothetical protein